jgi:hypothetical protein
VSAIFSAIAGLVGSDWAFVNLSSGEILTVDLGGKLFVSNSGGGGKEGERGRNTDLKEGFAEGVGCAGCSEFVYCAD